jgi:hypothetical protein
MGVKNGSQMLHQATVGSLAELSTILYHHCQLCGAKTPTIDVDDQWLCRKFSMLMHGPIPGILTFATQFLSIGVKVTIVDDGPYRHHSKKATIQHDALYKQARIESILMCTNLLKRVQQSRSLDITQTESSKLLAERKKLEKTVTSKENLIRSHVPESDFCLCLEEGINQLQEEWLVQKRMAEIEYVQARTQADAVICYHALNNMIDGAIANDSKFAVVAGGKMLQIDWKGGASKKKIQGIHISSPHRSVINECMIKTLKNSHSSIEEVAKFPLLKADDPML